jgi:hypothetical protein
LHAASVNTSFQGEPMNTEKFYSIDQMLPLEKELMRASDIASKLGLSKETIYDWKYRSKKKQIPVGMFVKIGKMLFINTKVLKSWLESKTTVY